MEYIEIDIIHESMRINQLTNVYLELDKYKTENIKLQKLIKHYKHDTFFYTRYYDAICCLILQRNDICELMKFIPRAFKYHS